MTKSIKKDAPLADNDPAELTAEEFAAVFQQIKDPEVRASIVALVSRLAEAAGGTPPQKRRLS